MKTYEITIPAYMQKVRADSEEEALEQFWFNYDGARGDPEFGKPQVAEISDSPLTDSPLTDSPLTDSPLT